MSANTPEAYDKLTARCRELALLGSTASLLNWDQETYMPKRAVEWRAEQLAYFSGKAHRLATEPEVGEWIKACEDAAPADEDIAANVCELRRDYDRATKLPAEFVEEMARTEAHGREAWMQARQESKFEVFEPLLGKLVDLCRRKADYYGWETTRYDALLDIYEPGSRSAQLVPLFDNLASELREILPIAMEKTNAVPLSKLKGDYPEEKQKILNREVAESLGFDFEAGRIDTTTHPFCTGLGPRDTRLTTRYELDDFTSSLFGVVHEAGHGMYDQGLRAEQYGLPLGESVSLGIHESQSRLWECQIARSHTFWNHWWGRACELFPNLRELELDEFWLLANHVKPSFIRVEADEVTYNLHIILRFELEKRLIEGDLEVADLPAAWNERFEELFGLKVDKDSNGCLQDIHWSMAGFGYFPTYTQGTLNAAQLYDAATRDIPGLEDELAGGRYGKLLTWLREKIHSQGRRFMPDVLMTRATGRPTSAGAYCTYLRRKFCS